MARVSVIVPVFQVEKYLRQCIDSILAQTFTDFELILVDDGASDGSPEICDGYERKYQNIHVIHQTNQGVGMARNRGVEAASGEYIMFLDSDDMLDGENALGVLFNCAENAQADITVGNYRRFSDKGIEPVCEHGFSDGDDSGTAAFRYRGFYLCGHLAFNWGKLYRRSFLLENQLRFQNYQLAEDKLYNLCCYVCHPRYGFTDESVVLYRRTENSLTAQNDQQFTNKWICLIEEFYRFLEEKKISEDNSDLIAFHIFYGSFFIVEQGLRRGDDLRGIVKGLREYGKRDAVKKAMGLLSRGKYLFAIGSFSRCAITWGAATAFSLHAYWLFAAATALFVRVQYG